MNNLKAVSESASELRVGNYMVLFGGKDLAGEFFTKSTNFNSNYTDLGLLYVDFEHGFDVDEMGNDPSNVLGVVDYKSARVDEKGIYVERILNRRADYMRFLEKLIHAGVIGTSSMAVPKQTARKNTGEITEWPLMRDTLTVTPMEPRMVDENALMAAKSLHEIFPHAKSLARLCGIESPDDTETALETIKSFSEGERFLRERGIAKSQAIGFVSRIKQLVRSESEAAGSRSESGLADLRAALKARAVHIPSIRR